MSMIYSLLTENKDMFSLTACWFILLPSFVHICSANATLMFLNLLCTRQEESAYEPPASSDQRPGANVLYPVFSFDEVHSDESRPHKFTAFSFEVHFKFDFKEDFVFVLFNLTSHFKALEFLMS